MRPTDFFIAATTAGPNEMLSTKVSVHHVEMQPVRAGGFDAPGLRAELRKIARQQGRGDDDLVEG